MMKFSDTPYLSARGSEKRTVATNILLELTLVLGRAYGGGIERKGEEGGTWESPGMEPADRSLKKTQNK